MHKYLQSRPACVHYINMSCFERKMVIAHSERNCEKCVQGL